MGETLSVNEYIDIIVREAISFLRLSAKIGAIIGGLKKMKRYPTTLGY